MSFGFFNEFSTDQPHTVKIYIQVLTINIEILGGLTPNFLVRNCSNIISFVAQTIRALIPTTYRTKLQFSSSDGMCTHV